MTFEEYARAHDLYFTEDYESDDFQIAREAWEAGQKSVLDCAYEVSLAAPKGYVLVPVEPTKEMVETGLMFHSQFNSSVPHVYRAMIQAAQEKNDASR